MTFHAGASSREKLGGGCTDIKRVVLRAYELSEIDFSVIETRRSVIQQRSNIEKGVSWTMDSDHLMLDEDGSGVLAVDLYPWVDGMTLHETDTAREKNNPKTQKNARR